MERSPLAIDLFCGLSGWGEGLLSEGYRVVGFDIENMFELLGHPMPDGDFSLVLQDVLTLHGSQFKDAALIVASPPCQEFSYMAMPWSRAKEKALWYRDHAKADDPEGPRAVERQRQLTALFDACFRIQREASEAAGHHIPMVVENVRGACPWVGQSRWNYGSFHLWGDVPALMPMTKAIKNDGGSWFNIGSPGQKVLNQNPVRDFQKVPGFRFDGSGRSFQTASVEETGHKTQGMNWSNRELRGQDFTRIAGKYAEGRKGTPHKPTGRKSNARKAASAAIAKIPTVLARHIAKVYLPKEAA